jgi:spore coat polysaccharide biosynthesis protein SpsF (cytidylyltransferase family)
LATPANSQLRAVPANLEQIQKIAADHEATNNALSSDPRQLLQQELIARAVADRQSQLRLDTEKLVALTAELKQHVDKAGANILSMDVIKKAQEIQKLAKSVQDKMRNAY